LETATYSSPSVIWEYQAQLGEGPVWDDQNELLYWLDIKGCRLLILNQRNDTKSSIKLSTQVGSLALTTRGTLIAATKEGLAHLDRETGALSFITDPEAHLQTTRFNDGKCDRSGNFIVGSMDELEERPLGTVYRLSADYQVSPLFGGYVVCNGPAFSPDGRILYFSNSAAREILEFNYDPKIGTIGEPTIFARIPDTDGYPDGLTVDAEGYIWCAHWNGGRLTRFSPDGQTDKIIEFPVPLVTSCTFGGKLLDTLFVTTARTGLTESTLSKAPLSGSLFAFKPRVLGLPTERFFGSY